jgi:hypothetical protein
MNGRSQPRPSRVRLTQQYRDEPTGMFYLAGTILDRQSSGQYAIPGTPLGGECVASLSLIDGIYEEVEERGYFPPRAIDIAQQCHA